ncbi:hypothetical protein JM83_1645 [Gillisia sp. Hel_I_86]|nr:hypothetical protein JM83_1645 [Gillisia sp. Hel_I_86]
MPKYECLFLVEENEHRRLVALRLLLLFYIKGNVILSGVEMYCQTFLMQSSTGTDA